MNECHRNQEITAMSDFLFISNNSKVSRFDMTTERNSL